MISVTHNHSKRSREDSLQISRKKQKSKPISKAKELTRPNRNVVALNQLPWEEVTLPDRFGDAEGFFGLEEIDGVEILKDAVKGTVQYRVGKITQGRQIV